MEDAQEDAQDPQDMSCEDNHMAAADNFMAAADHHKAAASTMDRTKRAHHAHAAQGRAAKGQKHADQAAQQSTDKHA